MTLFLKSRMAAFYRLFLMSVVGVIVPHATAVSPQPPCTFIGNAAHCQDVTDTNFAAIIGLIPEQAVSVTLEGSFRTVAKGTFKNAIFAASLRHLELASAALRVIEEDGLMGLVNLTTLKASDNNIANLTMDLCTALPQLTTLVLEKTKIADVNPITFTACPGLRELNLANNLLQKLGNGTFKNQDQLKSLDLSGNNLAEVSLDTFQGLRHLESLNLSDNPRLGINLHPGTLASIPNVTSLSIGHITDTGNLNNGLLANLENIIKLDISENNISSFDSINMTSFKDSLRELVYDNNSFGASGHVNQATFQDFNLTLLSLKHCRIETIVPFSFVKLSNLVTLDLSGNYLRYLTPQTFAGLIRLQSLTVVRCNLLALHTDTFDSLLKLEELHLEDNSLTTLTPEDFRNMTGPLSRGVHVDRNPWLCDCRFADFKRFLESTSFPVNVTCSEPASLSNKDLMSVHYSEFENCSAPTIKDCCSEELALNSGDTAVFQCQVSGIPTPGVKFGMVSGDLPRNRTFLSHIGSKYTLSIVNVQYGDSGDIFCLASDFLSKENRTKTYHLSVKTCDVPKHCTCDTLTDGKRSIDCRMVTFDTFEQVIVQLPVATEKLVFSGDVRTLKDNFLHSLPNVESLNMGDCNITIIESNAFSNTGNLRTLTLPGNYIEVIPDNLCAADALANLTYLTLDSNQLTSVSAEQLNTCQGLFSLDLSGNSIKNFTKVILLKLKELNLGNNKLQDVTADIFDNLPELVNLDLGRNYGLFGREDVMPFTNLRNLQYLTLSKVTADGKFPEWVFHGLQSVMQLALSGNGISCMQCINWGPVSISLRSLDLSRNSFVELLANDFTVFGNLETVDLGSCSIGSIAPGSFWGLRSLGSLTLENNPLRILKDKTFFGLTGLLTLNLRNCGITGIETEVFTDVPNLKRLNLHSNALKTIQTEAFSRLTLTTIDFDIFRNPFVCDCAMYDVKQWILDTQASMDIICTSPEALKEKNIRQIPDEQFVEGCLAPSISKCCTWKYEVPLGTNLTLKCRAEGTPKPNITYVVDYGNPLPENQTFYSEDKKEVNIHSIRSENAGTFRCVAKNKMGSSFNKYTIEVSRDYTPPTDDHLAGHTATYVGVGVAVTVIIIVVIMLVFYIRLRQKRHQHQAILLNNMN
ncbi:slit homolog 3 protein-like [Lineus longissimus]|uniref:slit homolog 3 protein-like n=1 Tax=Lineus longissimus TaxID=88925 RepID=UPI00315CAEA6